MYASLSILPAALFPLHLLTQLAINSRSLSYESGSTQEFKKGGFPPVKCFPCHCANLIFFIFLKSRKVTEPQKVCDVKHKSRNKESNYLAVAFTYIKKSNEEERQLHQIVNATYKRNI